MHIPNLVVSLPDFFRSQEESRLTTQFSDFGYLYSLCLKLSEIAPNFARYGGGAENDGHENGGPLTCPGMNLTNVKLTDQVSSHEIDGHEINGPSHRA